IEPGVEPVRRAAAAHPPAEREQRPEQGSEEHATTDQWASGRWGGDGAGGGMVPRDYSRWPAPASAGGAAAETGSPGRGAERPPATADQTRSVSSSAGSDASSTTKRAGSARASSR